MIELPGPQFVSRPGWGGQLKRWCSQYGALALFRLVIVVALVLIGRSLWLLNAAPDVPSPSPTPTPPQTITLYAQPGDGMTNIAARALDLYVAVQPDTIRLDAAQHLFAVDALARVVCWCPVARNQQVTFSIQDLGAVVDRALHLSPMQKAAWSRLLHTAE